MRIAVTAQDKDLDADFDPRFGRCRYFIIVNPDADEYRAFENQAATAHGGAGVQSAEFVGGLGVSVVITGHVGPKAARALEAAGITVFATESRTVHDAIIAYKEGKLTQVSGATTDSHSGPNLP